MSLKAVGVRFPASPWEYTYLCEGEVAVGQTVLVDTKRGPMGVLVTSVTEDIPVVPYELKHIMRSAQQTKETK